MEWFVKAFIRASLAWFTLGIARGLAMAAHPAWVVYRPAHAHMNVVGFITMMIFGVGYQLGARSAPVTTVGGSFFALGALSFVENMWKTFNAADVRHRARRAVEPGRTMPTLPD